VAFQRVPDTISITYKTKYTSLTQLYFMTMYFAQLGGWNDADIDTALAAAVTAWNTNLDAQTPTSAELSTVQAVNLDSEFGYSPVTTVANVGAMAGTTLPPNCAAYIKFTCASSGAPREGGVFFPYILESECDSAGNLSGSALTLDDDFSAIATAIEASVTNVTHVVPSRFSKTAVPTPPHKRTVAVVNNVASYSIRPVIASQRDRRG